MNRIERLIWEETQLKEIERSRQGSRGSRGAKVISIAAVVGAIALVAFQVSIPRLDESVTRALAPASIVYTPAGKPTKARDSATPATAARNAASAPAWNK